MSLTVAMSNALSGLTAVGRGVEVVSNNVANAGTEGYATRELRLGSRVLGDTGGGVRILGITRHSDLQLLNDLRTAEAGVAADDIRLAFRERVGTFLGDGSGEDSGALSDAVAGLAAALVEAANRPDSLARLVAATDAARELAARLNAATSAVQAARAQADDDIAAGVDWLNATLRHVQELNIGIVAFSTSGRDASGMVDARQGLIDEIARWIPVQEVARDHGAVALVSTGGAILLDGAVSVLGFSPVGVITADMKVGGALGSVVMDGRGVAFSGGEGRLGGGRLGALFDLRDDLAVEAQGMLDALARDLYERLADPAVDPTLAPGEPGIVTDGGGSFDPLDEAGLAGRLCLSAAVDPARGGVSWRLRDGLNAAAEGPPGNPTLLAALADGLAASRTAASGPLGAAARSAGAQAGQAASMWSAGTAALETRLAIVGTRSDSLKAERLRQGVDSDAEMQKLLALEQSYGANARVLSTIDNLLQQLLAIT